MYLRTATRRHLPPLSCPTCRAYNLHSAYEDSSAVLYRARLGLGLGGIVRVTRARVVKLAWSNENEIDHNDYVLLNVHLVSIRIGILHACRVVLGGGFEMIRENL